MIDEAIASAELAQNEACSLAESRSDLSSRRLVSQSIRAVGKEPA